MLKVMGLVLILTAAVGTGYSISRELSLREKNLRQYLMLIISLKGEIRYGNSSLAEAFQRTVPRLQGPFRELAEKLAKELDSVEGITLEQLLCGKHSAEIKNMHVTAEEQKFICSLGNRMGYLDRETEVRQLELYEEELKRHIEEIHTTIPSKKKIYRTLGIMGGFLMVILLW